MKRLLPHIAVFLGLAGFFFLVLSFSVHRKTDYVLPIRFSTIDRVRVETPTTTFNVLSRVEAGERVQVLEDNGLVAPVDQRTAFGFLAQLTRIAIVDKFPLSEFASPADREALGLGKAGKVIVQVQSGKVYTLEFGNDTASGTEVYAWSSAAPDTVYTISNVYATKLLPGWMDLRYRLALPIDGAEKIEITMEGASLVMVFGDGQWRAGSGISPDKVAPLVAALKSLKFENYQPVTSDDMLYGYGLAAPDGVITLSGKDGTRGFPFSMYNGRFYLLTHEHREKNIVILSPPTGTAFVRALSDALPTPRSW